MRCQICGNQTSANITIRDKRFGSGLTDDVAVCTSCFDDWRSENIDSLHNKIGKKLRVKE